MTLLAGAEDARAHPAPCRGRATREPQMTTTATATQVEHAAPMTAGIGAAVEAALAEFPPETPVVEIPGAGGAPMTLARMPGAPSAGGGLFAARGPREGHTVCWRVEGRDLELFESSSRAHLHAGALTVRFARALS